MTADRNAPDLGGVRVSLRPGVHPLLPFDRRELTALCERMLHLLAVSAIETEVLFLGDEEMSCLNRTHRHVPGPTNVLSFPLEESGLQQGLVALSVETLQRESLLYGQDPSVHLIRLLAHAFLHLSGLDHSPEMDRLTEQTLSVLESEFLRR
ncbi:MAG: rRNA maturation RNase YbeY [Desulfovibrionales bacterium]